MPVVDIRGITVDFPFHPYDVQREYMTRVMDCLTTGVNGVLESPTGTGKTLCLLCASLAWLTTRKAQLQTLSLTTEDGDVVTGLGARLRAAGQSAWTTPPKIIYASRTHSQLTQVIQELRRTSYGYVKTAVLGSRDQLCIHPQVSKEKNSSTKILLCQSKVTSRTCYFHSNLEKRKEERSLQESSIVDIEDMVKAGKKMSCCPYYLSRDLKQDADVVFMPYNYLIDPLARRAQGIELRGNVVIFDEAHNIEKSCEESASFQLGSSDVALCIGEVTTVMQSMVEQARDGADGSWSVESQSSPMDFTAQELAVLKTMFLELEKAIDDIQLVPAAFGGGPSVTKAGDFMLEILAQAHLVPERASVTIELLDKVAQFLSTNSSGGITRKGASLQKFSDLLRVVFTREGLSLKQLERIKHCYRLYIHEEDPRGKKQQREGWGALAAVPQGKKGKVLSYWCFSPSVGIRDLLEYGLHSLILTSGTLSPLDTFVSEMEAPFPVQLSNPHVVGEHQIWAGILTHGPDGTPLSSTYNNRQNPTYVASLGRTILNLSRVIPNGLLVFFPSYPSLRHCQEEWQKTGIWQRLEQSKSIHVEPQTKEGFQAVMELFYCAAAQERGACFMAVCRGKVSEGLDFADFNGRAVVVTGIPYPPFRDPRVMLKQAYLDEKKTVALKGRDWYRLEAVRAVNQAIGRVIRHRFDYGAIVLCDQRFAQPSFKSELSGWIQSRLQVYNHFGKALGDITPFYKAAAQLLPKAAPGSRAGAHENPVAGAEAEPMVVKRPVGGRSFQQAPSRLLQGHDSTLVCRETDFSGKDVVAYALDGASGSKPSSEMAADLFSVLESAVPDDTPVDFGELLPSGSRQFRPTATSGRKKRRITLVKPQTRDVEVGPVAPAVGSKEFLVQVKRILPEDKYKQFSGAIRTYFDAQNFDVLGDVLEEVFMKVDEHPHLFLGFQQFVREEHLSLFIERCRKLGLH